jgi:hypothetical protein
MKRLLRVPARAVATTLLVAGTLALPLTTPPAGAALSQVGPIDDTTLPAWYDDGAGTRLGLCVDSAPPCFTSRPDLASPPSATNLNVDGEVFWYNAEASIDRPNGALTFMRLAVEGTFSGGVPGQPAADQASFARVRFRIFDVVPGASYTVTYPYGTKTFTADALGRINDTQDIGCFPANVPCAQMPPGAGFDAALGGGVGAFLKWDPAVGPAAPAGYIGSFGTPHPVVGSPVGQNFFRINGPNIGGVGVNQVQTNLFDVAGKLAVPTGVALTPTAVTFPDTQVGTVSTNQITTLTNNGTSPVTVSSAGMGGGNIGDFRIIADGCSGRTVAVGGNCTISTRFEPSGGGTRTTTLTIASTATNSPHSATLTGRGLAAAISVSPLRVDFGRQKVNTSSAVRSVTVTSTGNENVTINAADLAGINAGDFLMVADHCTGAVLAPGAACGVDLVFDPTVAGTRSATLTITSTAPGVPTVVPIVGTGSAPATSFNPSSLDFGGVLILLGSGEQTVTLTNRGNAPLAITGWSISGTNASDFSISTKTCGTTLAAGAKCTVTVRFSPTFLGSRSATLTLGSDAPTGNATTVPLSGRGTLLIL